MESKIMATRKSTPHNYKDESVFSPSLLEPTRLTPQQLEEKRAKGLCYNCDNKYIKGHKCVEMRLFYIDCEEEEEKDQEMSKEEDIHQELTLEKEEMNPTISCNALVGITTPQTIKIERHIKKKNVQVKDHIEHQEMNPTIAFNALEEITTPQTLKIEGHIKQEMNGRRTKKCGHSFKSCRRSQFKQYCQNLTRKEKSYWNLEQSQK